jgi:hypothetical protein
MQNNDSLEPFLIRNELTPRAIGRYSYRDVKELGTSLTPLTQH